MRKKYSLRYNKTLIYYVGYSTDTDYVSYFAASTQQQKPIYRIQEKISDSQSENDKKTTRKRKQN